jgi:glycosyltransferase involved in cell wall biosynthesis
MPSSSPKIIAIVAPDLSTAGGLKTVVEFLHRTLQASDHYRPELVSVALSSTDRASVRLAAPVSWNGVEIHEEATGSLSYQHVGAHATEVEYQRYQPRRELTKLLNQADLVQVVAGTPAWAEICRDVSVPVALQVATLARVERAAALTGSGWHPVDLWRRAMTRLTDHLDHRALRHVDTAFVENVWMEEHLSEHFDPDRVVFAPPGVDLERYTPGPPPSEGDFLLSVGRFADPRKNVSLLFDAYAELRSRLDEPPPLVLAGRTAPPDEAWRRAERLGIREAVTMHEDIPLTDLTRLYRKAALYVVSSDEEGLGLTILEAMASGRPVVSTACGGPSTTVRDGKTGHLTPVGDASALATAMETILTAPDRADAMGRAGRRRVEEHFSAEATGQRFLDEYDRLLDAE